MNWTDAAIEDLKRLALEGRSASVIAAALGGASRNAVIGKASRIGIKLNGDGRGPARGGAPAGAHRTQPSEPQAARPVRVPRGFPSACLDASTLRRREERKAAWIEPEVEIKEMRRVRFEEIREPACRWPLGDPKSGDFVYCGLERAEGHSYCAGHRRMAYRAPNGGVPREQRRSLANSWRVA
jgi:GcrA cell cycle regulator